MSAEPGASPEHRRARALCQTRVMGLQGSHRGSSPLQSPGHPQLALLPAPMSVSSIPLSVCLSSVVSAVAVSAVVLTWTWGEQVNPILSRGPLGAVVGESPGLGGSGSVMGCVCVCALQGTVTEDKNNASHVVYPVPANLEEGEPCFLEWRWGVDPTHAVPEASFPAPRGLPPHLPPRPRCTQVPWRCCCTVAYVSPCSVCPQRNGFDQS